MDKARNIFDRIRTFDDWYKLVFPFNRLFRKGTFLYLRGWGKVWVPNVFADDLTVFIHLFTHNEYHIQKLKLNPHPHIIDIGANVGAFSILIKKQYPAAQVTSYEPDPENFKSLKKNAPFADVRNEAVAGKAGMLRFDTSRVSSIRYLSETGDIIVKAVDIHEVLAPYNKIDLLKIDVEGAEYGIYDSITSAELSKVENIYTEIHTGKKHEWGSQEREALLSKLQTNGFFIKFITPHLFMASRNML